MLKMIKQKRAYVFAAVISLSLAVALLFLWRVGALQSQVSK